MPGPPPAVAATRSAVRAVLRTAGPGARVLVAVSGGADSLALAAAAADEAPRAGTVLGAVVVDHHLQAGSAAVVARAADQCRALGIDDVAVREVVVAPGPDGPEAAARTARYAALADHASRVGASLVLLGHTEDDQAEQVLLGALRGSGARSLAGMPLRRGVFARPFLGLARSMTRQACVDRGLSWWEDPHNADPAYRRTAAREALATLVRSLGPAVVPNLARTAALLRADADHLDDVAASARQSLGPAPVLAADLAVLPGAVRRRVLRLLATEVGCPAGALTARHVAAMDSLVTRWHGQGPVGLPGGRSAWRRDGRVGFDGRGEPGDAGRPSD